MTDDRTEARLAALEAAVVRLDRYVHEDAIVRNERVSAIERRLSALEGRGVERVDPSTLKILSQARVEYD